MRDNIVRVLHISFYKQLYVSTVLRPTRCILMGKYSNNGTILLLTRHNHGCECCEHDKYKREEEKFKIVHDKGCVTTYTIIEDTQ